MFSSAISALGSYGSQAPFEQSLAIQGPTQDQLNKYPALQLAWDEFQVIYKLTVPLSERKVEDVIGRDWYQQQLAAQANANQAALANMTSQNSYSQQQGSLNDMGFGIGFYF